MWSILLYLALEILSIGLINQALSCGDPQKTLAALLLLSSGLTDIVPQNGKHYHDVLTRLKKRKAEVVFLAIRGFLISLVSVHFHVFGFVCMVQISRDPGAELWLADIQEGVSLANQNTQKALKSKCVQYKRSETLHSSCFWLWK